MNVRFKVSGDFLADSLYLPERHVLRDVERDGQNFWLTIALYPNDGHDDLTVEVVPTVTKQEISWEWNLPTPGQEPRPLGESD